MKNSKIATLIIAFVLIGLGALLKTHDQVQKLPPLGQVAGRQTNLLVSLIPDLPLSPDIHLVSLLQKPDGVSATLETNKNPSEIWEFYNQDLKEKGWQSENKIFTKNNQRLEFSLVQNSPATQTIVLLNYVLVPIK